MKKGLVLLVIIGSLIVGMSCANAQPTATPASSIKIGMTMDLSGPVAEGGQIIRDTAKVRLNEINAAGGIKGRMLELIVRDDAGQPQATGDNMRTLYEQGCIAIVGNISSSTAIPFSQMAAQYKIPSVNCMAVTESVDWSWYFSCATTETEQFNCWLVRAKQLGAKTVAIERLQGAWGDSCERVIKRDAANYGITVLGVESHSVSATDLTAQVSKLKALKPDLIIAATYLADNTAFCRALKQLDWNVLSLSTGNAHQVVVESAPDLVGKQEGFYYCDTSTQAVVDVFGKYEKLTGIKTRNSSVAYGWDGINIVAEGLKTAANFEDRQSVRDAIEKIKGLTSIMGKSGTVISFSTDKHYYVDRNSFPWYGLQGGSLVKTG